MHPESKNLNGKEIPFVWVCAHWSFKVPAADSACLVTRAEHPLSLMKNPTVSRETELTKSRGTEKGFLPFLMKVQYFYLWENKRKHWLISQSLICPLMDVYLLKWGWGWYYFYSWIQALLKDSAPPEATHRVPFLKCLLNQVLKKHKENFVYNWLYLKWLQIRCWGFYSFP